ncbi:hypothetical protein KCMC57_64440 (plasmid) [Kitasatospora sp. CMC57]|uniref:Uncharacterized protein n=1 Tax=Kitasatospora sp. CMC57 TaxID=3231513 RepID=A0AB33K3K7_9ACTN
MKPTVLRHPAKPGARLTPCTVFLASDRRRAPLLRGLPEQCGECGRFDHEHFYEPVTEPGVRPLFFVRQYDTKGSTWWWIGIARHITRRPAADDTNAEVFFASRPFPRQRSTR